jgi:Mg2+-importing ATPase
MRITLVLAVFILVVNLLNHKGVIESALFALALAVGMAPGVITCYHNYRHECRCKADVSKKSDRKKINLDPKSWRSKLIVY